MEEYEDNEGNNPYYFSCFNDDYENVGPSLDDINEYVVFKCVDCYRTFSPKQKVWVESDSDVWMPNEVAEAFEKKDKDFFVAD